MAQLTISLFGTFQITSGGIPITDFDSNKIRALLAYLVVECDRPHTRETLSALLWPDWPQESALASLRNALASLRRTIGDRDAQPPYLLITRDTIQFNRQSNVHVDVWEFARSAKSEQRLGNGAPQSAIEYLQPTVLLYRGPFLAGFSIPDSAPFEEWVTLQRERMGQQALYLLRQLVDFYETYGDYETARGYAQRQVELEPWLEEAHRQIMRLWALTGQRSAALAQYDACKHLLAEELGIEPAHETTQLYEIIRQNRLEDLRGSDPLPAPGEPPFKGLQCFDESDSALFFGREALTQQLTTYIMEILRQGFPTTWPIFTIVGASGSGKSSLVRAGLIPALRRDGCEVKIMTPGAHPHLPSDFSSSNSAGGERWLLVIDQFEEVFTLCHDETERQAFINALLPLALTPTPDGAQPPIGKSSLAGSRGVMIVLRADFYGHCAQYPRLREALCVHQKYIGPMSAEGIRRAIETPASQADWHFEPGLVALMMRDIGVSEGNLPEPGALPLLEHALLETWKRRRGRTLTLKGYAESGGVHGAIAHTAEKVLEKLSAAELALARRIFLRLTELGEGTQDTRRRAPIHEMGQDDRDLAQAIGLLHTLAEARLVTLAEDTVEVAHEALIREWPTLRQWLTEDRDGLRLHRRLTDSALAWQRLGNDIGELYRGARLAQASEWAAAHEQQLNALESDFLCASQRLAKQEIAEREAQRQRELDAALRLAETERQRAEEKSQAAERLRYEANLSYAHELAALSHSQLSTQPDLSLLLALQAVDTLRENGQAIPWNVQQAVHNVALTSRLIWSRFTPRQPWQVMYLPDGEQIAFCDEDRRVHFLDAAAGVEMQVIQIKGRFFCFADGLIFSADGESVYAWDRATGCERLVIPLSSRNGDDSGQVAISPDRRFLAAADRDNQAYLFDLPTILTACAAGDCFLTSPLQTYPFAAKSCLGFTFSPDGKYLATSCTYDRNFILWDVVSGQPALTLNGHTDLATGIAFSPDGKRVATCSFDHTARVWEIASGKELFRLTGHTHWISNIAYSPDGSRIATAGFDGQIILWDAAAGLRLFNLPTTGGAFDLSFSSDGTRLVSTAESGYVQMWDVTLGGRGELGIFPLPQMRPPARGMAASPDQSCAIEIDADGQFHRIDLKAFTTQPILNARSPSREAIYPTLNRENTLLAASCAGELSIWRIPSGERVFHHPATADWNETMEFNPAFRPGSSQVVFGGYPEKIVLWDWINTSIAHAFSIAIGCVNAVQFSPDGRFLAVGGGVDWHGGGGQVWIWDLISVEASPPALILHGDTRLVTDLDFSPNGQQLAVCGADSIAKIWQIDDLLRPNPTAKPAIELRGHLGRLSAIRYSPDGLYLLTNSADRTIKVWDAHNGEEVLSYILTGTGGFDGACFTADSQGVVGRGKDIVYYTFAFRNFDELLDIARQRLVRDWRPEERHKVLRSAR